MEERSPNNLDCWCPQDAQHKEQGNPVVAQWPLAHHLPSPSLSLPREAGWRQGRVTHRLCTGLSFSSCPLAFQGEKGKMRSSSRANNYPLVRGRPLSLPCAELPARGREAQGQGDRVGNASHPSHSPSPLTSSTAVPCMAQQEERLKRERGRRYTWGVFLFLKPTMHSAELRVSLAKGDERQGSGRTKSNSQLFHVCSSDGTGQKRQPAILIQAGQIVTEVRDSLTHSPLLPSSPSTSAKLFHKDRRVIF